MVTLRFKHVAVSAHSKSRRIDTVLVKDAEIIGEICFRLFGFPFNDFVLILTCQFKMSKWFLGTAVLACVLEFMENGSGINHYDLSFEDDLRLRQHFMRKVTRSIYSTG